MLNAEKKVYRTDFAISILLIAEWANYLNLKLELSKN